MLGLYNLIEYSTLNVKIDDGHVFFSEVFCGMFSSSSHLVQISLFKFYFVFFWEDSVINLVDLKKKNIDKRLTYREF